MKVKVGDRVQRKGRAELLRTIGIVTAVHDKELFSAAMMTVDMQGKLMSVDCTGAFYADDFDVLEPVKEKVPVG